MTLLMSTWLRARTWGEALFFMYDPNMMVCKYRMGNGAGDPGHMAAQAAALGVGPAR